MEAVDPSVLVGKAEDDHGTPPAGPPPGIEGKGTLSPPVPSPASSPSSPSAFNSRAGGIGIDGIETGTGASHAKTFTDASHASSATDSRSAASAATAPPSPAASSLLVNKPLLFTGNVTIAAGNVFQQRVPVAGACCVGWRFHLHERDLNFGIFFEPTAGGASAARTLRPMARVDARAAEEGTSSGTIIRTREYTGDIEVRGDGVCVLTWDNSYSYFTSKELTFQYSASSPAIKSQKRLDELRTVLVGERGELQAAVERAVAMQEEMARLREDVEARQGHVTQIAGALASTALALVPENARAHIFGFGTVHDLAASRRK